MVNITLGAKIELSKRYFFDYCNLLAPDFYKKDRKYLVELANELQAFLSSEDDVLVINEPPRHGKSRTAGMFVEWMLGNDTSIKIMTGSYNETLSTVFSKSVRNKIQEVKADLNVPVYTDVFPNVAIKHGDGAMNLWSLEGEYNNYLATSPTGTATGFGADYIIIDDLIKSAEEANNATVLEKHWEWFTNTMLSRLETGGKIIIIMTRWHSKDLAGKALEELPKMGFKVKHVSAKAYNKETDTMLCEEVLSKAEYFRRSKTMGLDIASANYQQEPIDIKGRLYKSFKTYDVRSDYKKIWSYTDTADEGKDYLCSIVWGETKDGRYEVLDVIYTQKSMEYTESAIANQFINFKVNQAEIESNNGGRGFARNVKDKIKGKFNTAIRTFHQSTNKNSRIYSNSYWIEQNVYFPSDWAIRWTDYYESMTTYQAQGKNKHDDAQDATTGIAETMSRFISVNRKEKMKSIKGFF